MEDEKQGTNANLTKLAAVLADSELSSFSDLITRKKGLVRQGRIYGDDLVQVRIKTKFDYGKLLWEASEELRTGDPEETIQRIVVQAADKGLLGFGKPVNSKDVQKALQELQVSLEDRHLGPKRSANKDAFEPLAVDGEKIPGARVYKGSNPEIKRGTIYIQGLKESQVILQASPNGPKPPAKSKGVSIAKRLLRKGLPIGRYVSYELPPGKEFILRLGGTVAISSTKDDGIRFHNATTLAESEDRHRLGIEDNVELKGVTLYVDNLPNIIKNIFGFEVRSKSG